MDKSSGKKIQLFIKSPYLAEDITIDCDRSWSVEKIKDYLSDTYPTKPLKSEQKLIYCGRFLPDHLILNDILPQDHSSHAIHLVCPHSYNLKKNVQSPSVKDAAAEVEQADSTSNTTLPNEVPWTTLHAEGLRQRLLGQPQLYMPQAGNVFGFHQVPFPANMHNVPPAMTLNMAHQLALMHQSNIQAAAQHYAQYNPNNIYWSQYSYGVPTTPPPTPAQNIESTVENQTPAPNQQNNAVRHIVRNNEDDEENMDLLDAMYMFTRVALLVMALYFYSSFQRIFYFVAFIVGIFVYRVGIRVLHSRAPPRSNSAAVATENNSGDSPQAERQNQQESEAAPNAPNLGLSIWTIATTFIRTFFISLIPEPLPA